jgi:hypothetical protein
MEPEKPKTVAEIAKMFGRDERIVHLNGHCPFLGNLFQV